MTTVPVDFARLAAPSFQSCKRADPNFKGFAKGNVPSSRVIVANGPDGAQFVHFRIFRSHEISKALEIARAVEARGYLDTAHWRPTNRKEY